MNTELVIATIAEIGMHRSSATVEVDLFEEAAMWLTSMDPFTKGAIIILLVVMVVYLGLLLEQGLASKHAEAANLAQAGELWQELPIKLEWLNQALLINQFNGKSLGLAESIELQLVYHQTNKALELVRPFLTGQTNDPVRLAEIVAKLQQSNAEIDSWAGFEETQPEVSVSRLAIGGTIKIGV